MSDASPPDWVARVRGKLAACAVLDGTAPPCGVADGRGQAPTLDAEAKRFALAPPIDLAEVVAFEAAIGAPLPADYRAFLLHLGNGGAGPDYGLLPLARWSVDPPMLAKPARTDGGDDDGDDDDGDGAPPRGPMSDPARPFRMTARWSVRAPDGTPNPPPLADGGNPFDGCTLLADRGCGYGWILVLHGAGAGIVWADDTAVDAGGLGPDRGFVAWYEDWLDATLRVLIGKHVTAALAARAPLASELHAIVVAQAGAFDDDTTTARRGRIELDVYLDRRAAAERGLAELIARDPSAGVSVLVRCVYRDAHDDAVAADVPRMIRAAAHARHEIRLAVANNAAATDAVLAPLADDDHAEVRLAVVSHAAALPAVLARVADATLRAWAAHGGDSLRLVTLEAIARHAATPIATVLQLAAFGSSDRDPLAPWVARAAACNAALPAPQLLAFAGDANPLVRAAAACHPALPIAVVETLAADDEPVIRLGIAVRSDAPLAVLVALAADRDERVVAAVACNDRTPPAVLARLVVANVARHALTCSERVPPAAAAVLALHPSHFAYTPAQRATAATPYRGWPRSGRLDHNRWHRLDATAREVIEWHSYSHPAFPPALGPPIIDEQYGIGGYHLAEHPWLPDALVAVLAVTEYGYTRKEIARRVPLAAAIIAQLAGDAPFARIELARRADLDAAQLAAFAGDRDAGVRAAAAANPRLAFDAWLALARDVSDVARAGALASPHADVATLAASAGDASMRVRWAAAGDPRTPIETVRTLRDDLDKAVRAQASWQLAVRELAAALAAEVA